MDIPKPHPNLILFSNFLREFQDESDRGAAILAGSMLDEKLKNVLSSFLLDVPQAKDLLSGYNAPIGTFSSRINMSLALGLIDKVEYEELVLVKKIRNDFAHKFELQFSFADPRISQICKSFKADVPGTREEFLEKPRFLFINSVVTLSVNLLYREEHVKNMRLRTNNWKEITWREGKTGQQKDGRN